MNTIDHGKWVAYTPVTLPPDAPANALFVCRESDSVDWYEYVNEGTNFNPANVVITAYWGPQANSYIVAVATKNFTVIFPQGCIVHEVTDYSGSDPQGDLGAKAFNPATGEFTDPVIPVAAGSLAEVMQDLTARIAALEAKQGGA